eukprot:g10828.t1.1.5e17418b g10828  g10828.t1 contig4:2645820-2646973(+)
MCPPTTTTEQAKDSSKANASNLKAAVGFLGLTTVGLLASTIVLATQKNDNTTSDANALATVAASGVNFMESKDMSNFFANEDANVCAGAKLAFDNKLCADLEVPVPQAGGNVTKGYVGGLDMGDITPNTKPYFQSSMCPVNVHWHLGSEHYSYGEFDENGNGPHGNVARPSWANRDLATDGAAVADGFRCHHYDENDPKFTTKYDWKHCHGMEVGETYEVHWPHSAAGACGTVNQYQTPFYDGVFCNLPMESFTTLGGQDIANAVGVHGQVFTIVNDESYFYPDMIRGMIVEPEMNMGQDIAMYTGSTTGDSRSNEMCSQYAPISKLKYFLTIDSSHS